jgi:hypothetical protein
MVVSRQTSIHFSPVFPDIISDLSASKEILSVHLSGKRVLRQVFSRGTDGIMADLPQITISE